MIDSQQLWSILSAVVSNEATEEESAAFEAWLAADESNRLLYEEVCKIYASQQPELLERDWHIKENWKNICQSIEVPERRRRSVPYKLWSYAAAAIVIVTLGISLFLQPGDDKKETNRDGVILILADGEKIQVDEQALNLKDSPILPFGKKTPEESEKTTENKQSEQIRYNRLITPQGRECSLTLHDGTRVWLNSNSELIFPESFQKGKREVELKGEAYFEVAKDHHIPFLVKTEALAVKVYGTSFNVSCYTQDPTVKTTLVEGKVSIIRENQEKFIVPSEQLTFRKDNLEMTVEQVDVNLFTQWRNGKYYFQNVEIGEIMELLGAWADFSVTYKDENMKHRHFTGVITKQKPVSCNLDLICRIVNLRYSLQGNLLSICE